ncbi:MAG TPA: response regulator [Sphingomonas sp.]|uniref:response regulator n=1 Tax=Sphingomonas sp. TaxID=28214 RepID=UPI002B9B7C5F|nr:response regulator [Sphingomonas sp.]HMI18611.1 response regulator [Sphingomonas sp.]
MARYEILIVDDSLTIRGILEQVLGADPDCRVVGVASDVDTARKLIKDEAPNVITLDLAMPGMDGMSFLDELSQHYHAPVVVISSSTTAGDAISKEAMTRGAAACFDKAKMVSEARRLLALLKRQVARETSRAA